MSQPLIMSFRPDAAQMCLDGRKTMTRRVASGKIGITEEDGTISAITTHERVVEMRTNTPLWKVGDTVAIKPKRTAKSIGRVLITGLRVEHVQDITEEDAKREGVEPLSGSYRDGFMVAWFDLYRGTENTWNLNPLVVVIEFKPVTP